MLCPYFDFNDQMCKTMIWLKFEVSSTRPSLNTKNIMEKQVQYIVRASLSCKH
jgi:hypothetical protein